MLTIGGNQNYASTQFAGSRFSGSPAATDSQTQYSAKSDKSAGNGTTSNFLGLELIIPAAIAFFAAKFGGGKLMAKIAEEGTLLNKLAKPFIAIKNRLFGTAVEGAAAEGGFFKNILTRVGNVFKSIKANTWDKIFKGSAEGGFFSNIFSRIGNVFKSIKANTWDKIFKGAAEVVPEAASRVAPVAAAVEKAGESLVRTVSTALL